MKKKHQETQIQNAVSLKYKNIRLKLKFSRLYHYYTAYKVLSLLNNRKNIKLLDFCCGTSNLFPLFNKMFKNSIYFGMDISNQMLNIGRKKYNTFENFNVNCQDGENLDFNDEEFDAVISRAALHHLSITQKGIYQIQRVLKKNGYVILLEPISNIFIRQIRRLEYKRSKSFSILHKSFKGKTLIELLKKYNLEIIEKKKIGLFAYIFGFPDIFPILGKIKLYKFLKRLVILDEYLLKLPIMKHFNWVLIIKLRKK